MPDHFSLIAYQEEESLYIQTVITTLSLEEMKFIAYALGRTATIRGAKLAERIWEVLEPETPT